MAALGTDPVNRKELSPKMQMVVSAAGTNNESLLLPVRPTSLGIYELLGLCVCVAHICLLWELRLWGELGGGMFVGPAKLA